MDSPHLINLQKIEMDAFAAGIPLSAVDKELLACSNKHINNLNNTPPDLKAKFGLANSVIPNIKISWELELFMSRVGHSAVTHYTNKLGGIALLKQAAEIAGIECRCTDEMQYESAHRGIKFEVASKELPYAQAVEGYYRFRKALTLLAKKKHIEITKYSLHEHFCICDQQGKNQISEKRPQLTDAISKHTLAAIDGCLPLVASPAQVNSTDCDHLKLAIADKSVGFMDSRSYVLRVLYDSQYDKSADPDLMHFELRRTMPGRDCRPDIGFDGFPASLSVITGGINAAFKGHEAHAVTDRRIGGVMSWQDRVSAMQVSPVATIVLGTDLQRKITNCLINR